MATPARGRLALRLSSRRNAVLIITRRPGERIMLGDDVVVEVIEVRGTSVRVGIAAPRSLPVYREEIWQTLKDEGARESGAGP
jgi:carbon storage regulator